MTVDANNWLMAGASVPSCTFPAIGTRQGGTLIEPAPFTQQQRDLATSQPKFWDNGDPMQQLVVTMQTDERDPANPEDDGVRRLYVKGQMQKAVAQAVRRAGARGLNVGGELWVDFVGQEEPKARGFNGAKVYAAEYHAPNPSAAFLAKPEAAQAQPAPTPGAYAPQATAGAPGAGYAPQASTYQQQSAAPVPGPDTYQAPAPAGAVPLTGAITAQLPASFTPEQLAALQAAGITGLPQV